MTNFVTISETGICSVERSFEILGGAWTFLVLREALLGEVVRFDEFQNNLGIARQSLRRVLDRLVRNNVFVQQPLRKGGSRKGYFLTPQGRDLLPSLVAAISWGQRWHGLKEKPEKILHKTCGGDLTRGIVCSACKEPVDPRAVAFESRIKKRSKGREKFAKSRYVELALLERQRPCSIAKTMATIGDPWSFLIIRECFYGVRRFDAFQKRLAIASNILAARLKRLVAAGVLELKSRPDQSGISEYRMTEIGLALYDLPLTIIAWGDKWLVGSGTPPLVLTHKQCGNEFRAILWCHECREEVAIDQIDYHVVRSP
jgi:DNA-binding HxlR family transcriptional regulator